MNESSQIDYFYGLSEILTGYKLVKLYGTGQGDTYFKTLKEIVGPEMVADLLNEFEVASKTDDPIYNVNQDLLCDEKLGPVCRNIIKMWFMGKWFGMEAEWQQNYVSSPLNVDTIISPNSFIEGLVWDAMGQHPQSAKQPGYGTWAFKPESV